MWPWLIKYLDCTVLAICVAAFLVAAVQHLRLHRRLQTAMQSRDPELMIPLALRAYRAPLAYWNRDAVSAPPDAQVRLLQHADALIRSAAPLEPVPPAAS
jgi:hypothetical protein